MVGGSPSTWGGRRATHAPEVAPSPAIAAPAAATSTGSENPSELEVAANPGTAHVRTGRPKSGSLGRPGTMRYPPPKELLRMEVRIGVVYSPKELTVDIDSSPEQIVAHVEKALAESAHMLWMHDDRGRRIGVPLDKIAYVEIAQDDDGRRVGFGR